MKKQARMDKKFYIATNGLLAEECARKMAKRLRKHNLKIRTAAVPTSRLGNTVLFRDYWIEVDVKSINDLMWILVVGSWLSGEYHGFCNSYIYREVDYGDSMEECWKNVYEKR